MGGGHAPGKGRRATSEFPAGWTDEQIIAVIKDVANDPSEPRRRQHNGRWRCAGERYGVHLIVLVEDNGSVKTGYPVAGPGVVRNPDAAADPANPTVADLAAGRISFFGESLLDQIADRVTPDVLAFYRTLHWSGEWEELADVLVAHAINENLRLGVDEFATLESLLNSFDLPIDGFLYLNDRAHTLATLRP
ncbi:EndoU domain-containing protein [Amycolatopsis sp. lyj-90]|uniref:EndoU domain-containing protein n=1 Tax=Amycolatopsis sp. lyj-90 TaxID=2789285 RepID=UPI0039796938